MKESPKNESFVSSYPIESLEMTFYKVPYSWILWKTEIIFAQPSKLYSAKYSLLFINLELKKFISRNTPFSI
jgi:hypothetical protein